MYNHFRSQNLNFLDFSFLELIALLSERLIVSLSLSILVSPFSFLSYLSLSLSSLDFHSSSSPSILRLALPRPLSLIPLALLPRRRRCSTFQPLPAVPFASPFRRTSSNPSALLTRTPRFSLSPCTGINAAGGSRLAGMGPGAICSCAGVMANKLRTRV